MHCTAPREAELQEAKYQADGEVEQIISERDEALHRLENVTAKCNGIRREFDDLQQQYRRIKQVYTR